MPVAVDRSWFEDRWKRKGLTLRKVALLIDIDASALSRTLSGEREMKLTEVGKIATVLDVEPNEVLTHMQLETGLTGAGASDNENQDARISRHPGFGFMRGLIKIQDGFDITGPFSDETWDEGYLGEDRF